jgi:acetylornithine deacetylase/succinyl-diaminopimelate desuccinylase-like protein
MLAHIQLIGLQASINEEENYMSSYKKIDSYLDKNLDQSLDELKRYVSQPSISAQNLGLKECAQIVKEMLERRGFKSQIMSTDGAPVVFAERKGKATNPAHLQSL